MKKILASVISALTSFGAFAKEAAYQAITGYMGKTGMVAYAFANPAISDIIATTIQSRTGIIADNVTKNNALLAKLKQRGNIKTFSGGNVIMEELSFQQNGNVGH